MSEYQINKGIGRSVEYKGLKAQYLFIFAGGLLAMFVVFVIMYIIGISQWFCHSHINSCLAHISSERQIWRTWTDETVGVKVSSAIHNQPSAHNPLN